VTEDVVDQHLEEIRLLVLDTREDSLEPGYHAMSVYQDRGLEVRLTEKEFNMHYRTVKREALRALELKIQEGIDKLKSKFLHEPTNLGSSSGDIDLNEVWVYPNEIVGMCLSNYCIFT
jgi:hypothetical protein